MERSLRARLLGGAFDLLYRSRTLYWLASTLPFGGQWRVWQRLVLPQLTGHDVLEVGCGIGTLLADLVAAGYHCRAVDASPQMVAATRAELRRRGLASHDVAVTLARVQQLPFGDAQFDAVVSTFPTPYIYDPAAIREIARVLRPGGRLIVVEGARLLAGAPLLWPLVIFQALVYGEPLRHALTHDQGHPASFQVQIEQLAERQSAIPLEEGGLMRRELRARTRLWLASLVIGEKAASPGAAS